MTTQKRTAPRGRVAPKSKNTRNRFFIGFITLIVVILIGSVALIGRQGTTAATNAATVPVQIAKHPVPANAEPNGRAWGPKDAPIIVIEYADYECESCGYFARNFEQDFVNAFAATGKVRFEIRNAPFHGEGSERAAQGAYCAAEQNMFWPFHDSLFLNQPAHGSAGFSAATVNAIATKVGMDSSAFSTCLSSGKYAQQVKDDYRTTVTNNVTGTPTFVINGKVVVGPQTVDDFRRIFAQVAPEVSFT